MSTTMQEFMETIDRARQGDAAAFARIVRQYQSLVSGVMGLSDAAWCYALLGVACGGFSFRELWHQIGLAVPENVFTQRDHEQVMPSDLMKSAKGGDVPEF